jgi:hypothetical protein
MRQLVVSGAVALMIAVSSTVFFMVAPATVMAQAASFDPAGRATVEAMAKAVGDRLVPGSSIPTSVVQIDT